MLMNDAPTLLWDSINTEKKWNENYLFLLMKEKKKNIFCFWRVNVCEEDGIIDKV